MFIHFLVNECVLVCFSTLPCHLLCIFTSLYTSFWNDCVSLPFFTFLSPMTVCLKELSYPDRALRHSGA